MTNKKIFFHLGILLPSREIFAEVAVSVSEN